MIARQRVINQKPSQKYEKHRVDPVLAETQEVASYTNETSTQNSIAKVVSMIKGFAIERTTVQVVFLALNSDLKIVCVHVRLQFRSLTVFHLQFER